MNDQNKKIKLELSLDEVNVILNALGKLPFESVFKTITDIRNQATTQIQPEPVVDATKEAASKASTPSNGKKQKEEAS